MTTYLEGVVTDGYENFRGDLDPTTGAVLDYLVEGLDKPVILPNAVVIKSIKLLELGAGKVKVVSHPALSQKKNKY